MTYSILIVALLFWFRYDSIYFFKNINHKKKLYDSRQIGVTFFHLKEHKSSKHWRCTQEVFLCIHQLVGYFLLTLWCGLSWMLPISTFQVLNTINNIIILPNIMNPKASHKTSEWETTLPNSLYISSAVCLYGFSS